MQWLRRGMAVVALLACGLGSAWAADAPQPVAAVASAHAAYSQLGADTCLGCHGSDTNVTGIFRTKHARPDDPHGPFGHGGLQCEACHGPGGAHAMGQVAAIIDFGSKAKTPAARQNAQCLTCHQSNTAHDWAASPHAAADVPCASCHRLHQPNDPMKVATTQIDTCTGCHQDKRTDLLKPSHHPLREGKMACTSCHSPHGSTAQAQLVHNTVNETCTSCHAEKRGPFLWEHQPVTEDCDNCHQPHGSVQPALLKLPPPFLCQACHEASGHPSVAGLPSGLAAGGSGSAFLLVRGCVNCHSQVHGSNSPAGRALMR
jgi:DmsE family decaheme c-type cytochrome